MLSNLVKERPGRIVYLNDPLATPAAGQLIELARAACPGAPSRGAALTKQQRVWFRETHVPQHQWAELSEEQRAHYMRQAVEKAGADDGAGAEGGADAQAEAGDSSEAPKAWSACAAECAPPTSYCMPLLIYRLSGFIGTLAFTLFLYA